MLSCRLGTTEVAQVVENNRGRLQANVDVARESVGGIDEDLEEDDDVVGPKKVLDGLFDGKCGLVGESNNDGDKLIIKHGGEVEEVAANELFGRRGSWVCWICLINFAIWFVVEARN